MAEEEENAQPLDAPNDNAQKGESEVDHKVENLLGGALEDEEPDHLDLSQFAPKTASRYEEIKNRLETDLNRLGSADLKARDNVIRHVGEALNDIYEIERKPRLNAQNIENNLGQYVKKIEPIHTAILNKNLEKNQLYEYIEQFVDLTGPNRDTTALFLSYEFEGADYLMNHTLNTIIIAISLGIELSKIMERKITTPQITNDLKKVFICSRKIFTRKELTEIGIAALLHDMHFRISLPNLAKKVKFTLREESLIEKHASEAYHFLRQNMPLLDFEITKAVYQHHEYMDGSGYPNGIEGRLFSRYAPILSFTTHYVEHTTENPFFPLKHPHVTLNSMMTTLRNKFDDDLLLAFVKGSGMFPLGSWVLLNTGHIGVVFRNNPESPKTPVVRAVLNSKFERIDPVDFDTNASDVRIHAPVPFLEVKKRVPDYHEVLFAGETPPSPYVD